MHLTPARGFALGLLLAGLSGCSTETDSTGAGGEVGQGGPRPNILLVTLDTTRPDYLSTYAKRGESTPNFDALANDGIRFDLAVSASAVTPVSHATILTGRFPYGHGLRVLSGAGGYRLPEDVPTLATALSKAGYRTAAVHSAFPVSSYFGLTRDFDRVDSFDGAMEAGADQITGWPVDQLQRRAGESVGHALKWLNEPSGQPFFLWLHLWDPHDSVLLPPAKFLSGLKKTEANTFHPEQIYAREVAFVDMHFGRLVAGLQEAGAWDNTLAIVTADHGEGLLDGVQLHDWFHHRMLYREQIHIPLIVRLPTAAKQRGRSTPDLVRSADVAPTVLDYAGIPMPEELHGRSLRSLIEGTADEPRYAYADQVNAFDSNAGMVRKRPDAAFLFSIQDKDWKLIWRPHMRDQSELFRVSEDPLESKNLWHLEAAARTRLLENLAERRPWVLKPFPAIDGGAVDAAGALAALGYGGGEGSEGLTWTWTCPEHLERNESRDGRCPDCDRRLLPVTEWK